MRPVRAAGPGLGPVRAGILPAKSRPLLLLPLKEQENLR